MSISTLVEDAPRIWVGTYGKYNSGLLDGDWFDLSDYSDKSEFYEAIAERHSDEHDPEFMFNDWENIPRDLVGESWVSDDVWKLIELSDDDRKLLDAFDAVVGESIDDFDAKLDAARERFAGRADSFRDWVYDHVEDHGLLDGVSDTLTRYFDYDAYGRDLAIDTVTHDRFDGDEWIFYRA